MTDSGRVLIDGSGRLTLVTLGGASLIAGTGQAALLGPGKPLALLVYLALSPGRTATREFLTGLLWADMDSERARHALRQTLWQLRHLLGEQALTGRDEIRLALDLPSDRDTFLAAVERADFEAAVNLYTGPFLPDLATPGGVEFEQWADIERDRLRATFLRACEVATRRRLSTSQMREAQRIARRARDEDPGNELGWRLLLESLVSGQDYISATLEADALEARFTTGEHQTLEPATRNAIRLARQVQDHEEGPSPQELVVELIGREREFAAIIEAAAQARKGPSTHVHVVAPAGLGKTRLLHDAGARLRATGWRVIYVRAHPGERQIGYALAGEIARVVGDLPGAGGVSPASAAALVAMMPILSSRLAAHPDPAVGEEALRNRTVALNEAMTAAADESPFALFIDDLHWADASSLRLLEGLLARIDGARVAVVTASRPSRGGFTSADATRVLQLQPLGEEQVGSFVTSIGSFPESQPWCQGFARGLTLATRGVPLLLLEMLKLGLERGTLTLGEEGWTCHDPAALAAQLREGEALRNRLGSLPREPRWTLTLMTAAGIPLTGTQLASAAGRSLPATEEDLEALERIGLVMRSHDAWDLTHDEIGTVALEELGTDARRTADRGVGRALAETAVGESHLLLVRAARHLAAAGDEQALVPLTRRYTRSARSRGDERSPAQLVAELLGEHDSPGLRRRLLRGLPLPWRLGLWSRSRMLGAAAAVLSAVVLTLAALTRPAAPPPEAELLLVTPAPDSTANVVVYQARLADWTPDALRSSRTEHVRSRALASTNQGDVTEDGTRWTVKRSTGEVTTDDLFLVTPQGETRLTEEPRDDLTPRWSPDGGWIAFLTARWSQQGADDYDVALMNPATREVRQLTRGPAFDVGLSWSPLGTRIAVLRRYRELRDNEVCWVTYDGRRERCVGIPGYEPGTIAGWLDHQTVLVAAEGPDHTTLLSVNLDTGEWRESARVRVRDMLLSRDGRWLACDCTLQDDQPFQLWLWPANEPRARRRIEKPAGPVLTFAWRKHAGAGYLDQLTFRRNPVTLPVGSTTRPVLQGTRTGGDPTGVSPSVLSWASSNPEVVTVDSLTGEVRALAPGAAEVTVSAGGWREARLQVTVTGAATAAVRTERWGPEWTDWWTAWGKPFPSIEPGPDGVRGLANNGEGSYASGAYSVPLTPNGGLGVEAMISTPITQSYWQTVGIALRSVRRNRAEQAVTLGMDAPLDDPDHQYEICSAGFPATEGMRGIGSVRANAADQPAMFLPVDSGFVSGAWFRLRVQLFPDGSCGFAINGQARWRSRPALPTDQPYRIWITGNSANTRVLVGPMEVWTGVRRDVEWDEVGKSEGEKVGSRKSVGR